MIDPSLRIALLAEQAADPEVAVVLLDVVLGHAADPDPAARLAPAISSAIACRARDFPSSSRCAAPTATRRTGRPRRPR